VRTVGLPHWENHQCDFHDVYIKVGKSQATCFR
jgi:hypothetical protein